MSARAAAGARCRPGGARRRGGESGGLMDRSQVQRITRVEAATFEAQCQHDAAWLATYAGRSPAECLPLVRDGHRRVERLAAMYGDDLPALAAALAVEIDCTPDELLAEAQRIADARDR